MCKVYNPIGCLTTIKSHLREHHIDEYKSLNELINFQKNYAATRQQIVSNHKRLVEQEKVKLIDEIARIEYSIKTKKNEAEQVLLLELGKLKQRLNNLPSAHSNIVKAFVNYVKKIFLKLKVLITKLFFNFKVTHTLKQLTSSYNEKNSRYQYIDECFDNAVKESSLLQLRELDRKKGIIDEINSSIYGALGEQKVVRELENLPDEYILINDFTCSFNSPIYNRQENDYIKSIQIDHLLLSPAGIFLIETKNWSQNSLNDISLRSPVQQIKRTNFALYRMLNGEISNTKLALNKHHWGNRKVPIKNLIVFIGHKPIEEFQYVKILTLNNLLSYIKYFKSSLSTNETQIIASYLLNIATK
jgi:hypothetical protein